MEDRFSFVLGFINFFSSKEELAAILQQNQIFVDIGVWSLRSNEHTAYFKIAYVGNITPEEPFEVEVSAHEEPASIVAKWCEKLSKVLTDNGIVHEFTHYTQNEDELKTYEYTGL